MGKEEEAGNGRGVQRRVGDSVGNEAGKGKQIGRKELKIKE